MDQTDYSALVIADLKEKKLTKKELLSVYATEQRIIRDMFGGQISDVPINHGEYWILDKKIQVLGRMNVA